MIPRFRAWDKHNQNMFANDELIIWNNNVYANDSKKLSCNQQDFMTREVQKFLKAISYIIRYRQNIPLLSNMTKTKVVGTAMV